MSNQQILEGSWNELKGQLREKWGQLTNDDLEAASGNVERLIGLVQRKTGESREAIDNFLSEAASKCQSSWNRTGQMFQDYTEAAVNGASQIGHDAKQHLHAGYVQSERFVRKHPMETLAVCLGVGLVAGLVATALTRR